MAGERWIAEAEDLKAAGTSGEMDGGKPRVTVHVTVSKPGSFDGMHGVLTRAKAEPHVLYDPATDRLGQYFPLDRSARALRNDAATGRRTNGHGVVNIQIEVCAMPDGFTNDWKPGPNWLALLRAIRSWGIPDLWPAGRLARHGSDNVDRSWDSYAKAGWFGHCNVPGNDHWDPGPIDQQALFAAPASSVQKEWWEMPIPKEDLDRITEDVWTHGGANGGKLSIWRTVVDTHAQVATLTEAVKALADARGADGAAITQAVIDKINALDLTVTVKE
jgi:hypothetical protein